MFDSIRGVKLAEAEDGGRGREGKGFADIGGCSRGVSVNCRGTDRPGMLDRVLDVVEGPISGEKLVAVDGYSVDFAESAPKDSYWDIKAVVTDTRTGAAATLHQGAKVRLDSTATCP